MACTKCRKLGAPAAERWRGCEYREALEAREFCRLQGVCDRGYVKVSGVTGDVREEASMLSFF